MATKKKPAAAALPKKKYTYTLNLHVQDFIVLTMGDVVGPVIVTNGNPPVTRADRVQKGKNLTLTILAIGAGKKTVTVTGRTSTMIFTFTFAFTVKAQLAAAKPPETLPSETVTMPLLPGAAMTVTYPQLAVAPPDQLVGKATVTIVPPPPAVVTLFSTPAPNVPLQVLPAGVGQATVTVDIDYLKFRMTGSPPAVWGSGAPTSVQGTPTKTKTLTGSGPSFSLQLVEVKENFDFKSRLHKVFVINVVPCPGDGCGGGAASG
jgi:hypothetical protein